MLDVKIIKLFDGGILVPHGTKLHANSSYRVTVVAGEFAFHQDEPARLDFAQNGEIVASCDLVNDPLRRTNRVGTLSLGADGEMMLYAVLGDAVLFSHPINVASMTARPKGTPAGRWTVADLGEIGNGQVTVSDMQQVKLSASEVAGFLDVTVPTDPFEAYVVVTGTLGKFPFDGIRINGAEPVWDHMDSIRLEEGLWTLKLANVAGTLHADLRAGRPSGTERDPDGALVTSTEVNR